MGENGFIKLHRSMLNWEWYQDINTKVVFLHCLLKANWETGRFQGVEVPRGSFVTSLSQLAKETGLTVKQVRTAINHLKETNEVASKTTSKFSVITINNYDKFQTEGKAEGNQGAGIGQALGNNIRNKEYKEEKKDTTTLPTAQKKAKLEDKLKELVEATQYGPELKTALKEWIDYHVEIKKPYKGERSFSALLKQVNNKLAGHTEHEMAEVINLSMAQTYTGILFDRLKEGGASNDRRGDGAKTGGTGNTARSEPVYGSYEWYKKFGM